VGHQTPKSLACDGGAGRHVKKKNKKSRNHSATSRGESDCNSGWLTLKRRGGATGENSQVEKGEYFPQKNTQLTRGRGVRDAGPKLLVRGEKKGNERTFEGLEIGPWKKLGSR